MPMRLYPEGLCISAYHNVSWRCFHLVLVRFLSDFSPLLTCCACNGPCRKIRALFGNQLTPCFITQGLVGKCGRSYPAADFQWHHQPPGLLLLLWTVSLTKWGKLSRFSWKFLFSFNERCHFSHGKLLENHNWWKRVKKKSQLGWLYRINSSFRRYLHWEDCIIFWKLPLSSLFVHS